MDEEKEKMISGYEKFMRLVKAEMLKVYSGITVEHALNPRNPGYMVDSDGHGKLTGPCGDTMEIFLKMDGETVTDASFLTDGCGTTIACGSMVTEIVKGKSIAEVQKINSEKILEALGGLPEEAIHCSVLAANALKAAVEDLLKSRNKPPNEG